MDSKHQLPDFNEVLHIRIFFVVAGIGLVALEGN